MTESGRRRAVLVTGAASGIGRSCVNLLAANGYTVFAAVHSQMQLNFETPSLDKRRIIPLLLDIRFDEDVKQMVCVMSSQLSDLELMAVVNCAGVGFPGPLELVETREVLDMFNINVVGQLRVVQACLSVLRANGGRIIMIGSTSSSIPGVFTGAYSASKFALEAMTSVLRAELAASGVWVSVIHPGVIRTPFWKKTVDNGTALLEQRKEDHFSMGIRKELTAWLQEIAKLTDHATDPEKVARTVLQALTAKQPKSRYIVGTKAKLKLILWKFLPDTLKDIIIRRTLSTNHSLRPIIK